MLLDLFQSALDAAFILTCVAVTSRGAPTVSIRFHRGVHSHLQPVDENVRAVPLKELGDSFNPLSSRRSFSLLVERSTLLDAYVSIRFRRGVHSHGNRVGPSGNPSKFQSALDAAFILTNRPEQDLALETKSFNPL
ncbi:MAG: hypothetical protein AUG51_13740 [Acidobacteria bacterium 13_1_20CM_3_53_8]|nr:MAG: hypothetical protein AUG51_13740 [Acidobacteria bacterium 13_1_20CM_3_53_8]